MGSRLPIWAPRSNDGYGVMPAVVQSLAYEPAQSCEAGIQLSLITVEFMFFVVTHFGVSRTEAH